MEINQINKYSDVAIEFPEYQHGITQKVSQIFSRFFTSIYDTFFDGNEPWKFEKYQRNLHCLAVKLTENISLINELKASLAARKPSELEASVQQLLNLLKKSETSPLTEQRQIFRNFTVALRIALKSPSYLEEKNAQPAPWSKAAVLIHKICEYHFTSVHLYSFCEKLVAQMIKIGIAELAKTDSKYLEYEGKDPLELSCSDQFKAIHAAPQSLKGNYIGLAKNLISGATGLYYDSQLGSNMPYQAYSFALKGKEIQVIRMGTPTIEYVLPPAQINPEFEAFVANHRVFYISLQNNIQRYIGNESQRNQALNELSLRYPDRFIFSCFSNDSDWYHQRKDYENIESLKDFKRMLIENLRDSSYHFPGLLRPSDSFFMSLLEDTLEDLFNIAPDQEDLCLTPKSRRVCIEIFHIKLALSLLEQSQADKFLIVCKDGKDRAGKDNALFFLYLNLLETGQLSPASIRVAKVYLHAVSLIVKKNTMNFRKKRFLEAFEQLNLPEVQARIAAKRIKGAIAALKITIID